MSEKKHRVKTRGNGQGSAYKRGNTWTASVVIGWRKPDDPSKPKIPIKRTKAGFATKRDALAYCPDLIAGGYKKPTTAPRLSYYWKTYESGKLKSLSDSKQTAYHIAWNRMEKLHDAFVDALTVHDLQTELDRVCKTYYTKKDCRTVLINLFTIAEADGFANSNMPKLIVLPELQEKERIPFSQDEQKALWKVYESGDRKAAMPIMMIYTGMMPGEMQKLRTENIDIENRVITGVGLKTKVRKKTPVVLAEILLPVVQDLIDNARPDGFIWTQSNDEWYKDYYAALEHASVRKLPPYSCRHTTATALSVTENIAPQTVKRIMRWSTANMLDRYAHPDTTDALNAVDKLKKE